MERGATRSYEGAKWATQPSVPSHLDSLPEMDPADELTPGTLVGRYVVVSRLGDGAMGIVYAAHDTELDRRIALKLLKPAPASSARSDAQSRRLLREAQAMAQLNHPNVVTVHDVGQHEGRVFVAMEFIEGTTLRHWLEAERRTWPRVLEMVSRAGQGLAAAHSEGLVHRDFKPDNVMVAGVTDRREGTARVLVMDFGLARSTGKSTRDSPGLVDSRPPEPEPNDEEMTLRGPLAGTPAYMAPEQHNLKPSGPAADQFAFCVTLWEGLFGCRPFTGNTVADLAINVTDGNMSEPPWDRRVPRWLRSALERGLAVEPRKRWPSMHALLDELSKGRARSARRRRLVGVGVVASLVAGVLGVRSYGRQRQIKACAREGAAIAETWNEGARTRLRAALVGTEVPFASAAAQKVSPWLDAQAVAWRGARERVCLHDRVERPPGWSDEVVDRAYWCLEDRHADLRGLVNALSSGDRRVASSAVLAASTLRVVDSCTDRELLARVVAPPVGERQTVHAVRAQLSRAAALQATGIYDDGLSVAQTALVSADRIGWAPVAASARVHVGTLLRALGRYDESEEALRDAYFQATAAGAVEVAVAAADSLAYTVGLSLARHEEGLTWARHAQAQQAKLPDRGGLARSDRLIARGIIHLERGELDLARPLLEEAVQDRLEVTGPDHPAVAGAMLALANVYRETEEPNLARSYYARALEIFRASFGEEHPSVARAMSNLGSVDEMEGEMDAARRRYEEALRIAEKSMGPTHPQLAPLLNNLALVEEAEDNLERAQELHRRALAIEEQALGPEHPNLVSSLHNLASVYDEAGMHTEAIALYGRALRIAEATYGPEHPKIAVILANLGLVHKKLGDLQLAKTTLQRCTDVAEAVWGRDHESMAACLTNLAIVYQALEQPQRALEIYESVLQIELSVMGKGSPEFAESLNNVGSAHCDLGNYERAQELFERSLSTYEAISADHPHAAYPLLGLARLHTERGQPDQAIAPAQRAMVLRGRGPSSPYESAVARFELARALGNSGSDRTRARTLAREAVESYRESGEPVDAEVSEVETWLQEGARH